MSKNENKLIVTKDGVPAYSIYLENNFLNLVKYLEAYHIKERKICIVTDERVKALYASELVGLLGKYARKVSLFSFEEGEKHKNLSTVQDLYEHLILEKFDRRDLLLALGGGVVGDLTGFAAATYLRGIDYIQVPTTLLAQVDSSIGGKTGVDFHFYKNMVGAFYQPKLVYMNLDTLKTLTDEQFYCGMGEILKHGLIKDEAYYVWTIEHMEKIRERDLDTLLKLVRNSCKIKREVVQKDPGEQGERALLNLGHTIGHAIEKLKEGTLLHGQCVALGTVASAHISWKRGYLTDEEFFEIRDMNVGFDLPISFDGLKTEDIITASRSDKKMEGDIIKFILLRGIGNAFIDRTVTREEMKKAIDFINAELEESYD